jgi:hypothetical protein
MSWTEPSAVSCALAAGSCGCHVDSSSLQSSQADMRVVWLSGWLKVPHSSNQVKGKGLKAVNQGVNHYGPQHLSLVKGKINNKKRFTIKTYH